MQFCVKSPRAFNFVKWIQGPYKFLVLLLLLKMFCQFQIFVNSIFKNKIQRLLEFTQVNFFIVKSASFLNELVSCLQLYKVKFLLQYYGFGDSTIAKV